MFAINDRHHFFHCIGTKLSASILLITAFVLAVSVAISLLLVRHQFDSLTHSQFESVLHAHENFIEHNFDMSKDWAKHVSEEPELREALENGDMAALREFFVAHHISLFSETYLMLLDSRKRVVYNSDSEHQKRAILNNAVVNKVLHTKKMQRSIVKQGDNFSLAYLAPIFAHDKNTVLGIALVGKKLNDIFLNDITKNTHIDMALLYDYRVISSTLSHGAKEINQIFAIYHDYQKLLQESGQARNMNLFGKEYCVIAKKMNFASGSGEDISIMLLKSRKELEVLEQSLMQYFLLLAFGVFILLVIYTNKIYRYFITPVHQLIETTYQIAKGKKGQILDESRYKDDFYSLAKNFNFMVSEVEEKNRLIVEQNKDLESRVQKRTLSLEQALYDVKKLTLLIEQSPVSIIITDLDANIEYVNPYFTKVTGYDISDVLGKNPSLLKSGKTDVSVYENLWDNLKRGKVWQGEFINRTKFGNIYWEHAIIAPVRNEHGQVCNYVSIKENVTEFKKIEDRNIRLGRILDNSLNEIYIFDSRSLHFLQVSKGAIDNLGYSMEELKELTPLDIKPEILPSQFENILQPLRENPEQLVTFTTNHRRKDGTLYPVEVHLQLSLTEFSSAFVAIVQDVSYRKQAEQNLKQAKERAEQANMAKTRFIANMSHELRTPLNAILGFSQVLEKQENLTPQQRKQLHIINSNGEHLLTLINEVLNISKIESGHYELNLSDFNLLQLLDELQSLFQEKLANKRLMLDIDSTDAPACIRSDKTKLRQILVNLIGNAIKFSSDSVIHVRVRQQPISDTELYLHFEVQDYGVGIAQGDLDYIFKDFAQSSSNPQEEEGTGLGLTISRHFIELMAGEISADSVINQGTTFRFNILAETVSQGVLRDENENCRPIALADGQPAYRILIVDNMESNRLLLVSVLAPLGFLLKEATNGKEAVSLWQSWKPHLILMDMRMPVMDGYKATQIIRGLAKKDEVVIIALTASAFASKKEKVLELGCDAFLAKPFQVSRLLFLLKKHLGLEYVYEEGADGELGNVETALPVDGELFNDLDEGLKQELKTALQSINTSKINELILDIGQSNQALAETLKVQIENFEYEPLIELLDEQE